MCVSEYKIYVAGIHSKQKYDKIKLKYYYHPARKMRQGFIV